MGDRCPRSPQLVEALVVGAVRPAARRASLLDIVSELPAFVISQLLGFHQSTGDNWTRESQGFGADYVAEISRR